MGLLARKVQNAALWILGKAACIRNVGAKVRQHCTQHYPSGKGRRTCDHSRGSDATQWFSLVAVLKPVLTTALNTQVEVKNN